jgi:glycosyltransferase involved in cell wall biosynthesis
MKKVSIIIPAYNCREFLPNAVESVLAQSFRDYELLIIDDGSTDGTAGIAARCAAAHPGIVRYLCRENAGPGVARNTGIRCSSGKYIAFIDADDVWLPDKLSRQIGFMENSSQTGLLYCDNYFVDRQRKHLEGYQRLVTLHRGMIAAELFQHCFILTSGVVIRRECLDTIGLFREDIRTGEDYDLFLRISHRYRIDWIEEKLFERRAVAESLSNQDDCFVMANDIGNLTRFVRERPEFYLKNRQLVRERLGSYLFTLGYTSLRAGRNCYALRQLLRSLLYRRSIKTLKCLLMVVFPYEMLKAIKERKYPGKLESNGVW